MTTRTFAFYVLAIALGVILAALALKQIGHGIHLP
jgi:hypothetical protein